jgi:hypothetical protein
LTLMMAKREFQISQEMPSGLLKNAANEVDID